MDPLTSPIPDRKGPTGTRGHEQRQCDELWQGEGGYCAVTIIISEETYRRRFRSAGRKEGEAYVELAVRLQDLLRKWMGGCESVEAALERIAVEQLLNTMSPKLRIWVSERKPSSYRRRGGAVGR